MICEEIISQREKDMLINRVSKEFGLQHCFGDGMTEDDLFIYFTKQCNVLAFVEHGQTVALVMLDVEDRRAEIHLVKLHTCSTKIGLKRLWEAIGGNIDELHSYITLDRKPITRFWKSLGFEVTKKNDGYYATMKIR